MRRRSVVAALLAMVVVPAWAQEPEAPARFIPLHLWTGAAWDGTPEIVLHPTSLSFGALGNKTLIGPRDWVHPNTGLTLAVYERRTGSAGARKSQLFALRDDRACLGRVYDSRGDYTLDGECKFPLGLWREGERRAFDAVTWRGSVVKARRSIVTILRLDYTRFGVDHCLQFNWRLETERGEVADDRNYVYCPGLGMVEPED